MCDVRPLSDDGLGVLSRLHPLSKSRERNIEWLFQVMSRLNTHDIQQWELRIGRIQHPFLHVLDGHAIRPFYTRIFTYMYVPHRFIYSRMAYSPPVLHL